MQPLTRDDSKLVLLVNFNAIYPKKFLNILLEHVNFFFKKIYIYIYLRKEMWFELKNSNLI